MIPPSAAVTANSDLTRSPSVLRWLAFACADRWDSPDRSGDWGRCAMRIASAPEVRRLRAVTSVAPERQKRI